jgi:hypothetical protein
MNYDGEWQYGRRHGKGWCLFPDKSEYEGDWANDAKQGKTNPQPQS